jgi:DNA-binding NarL/FixJ family response regulator
MMIRVGIVDDDVYARELLRMSLDREEDLDCVGAVGSADSAVKLVGETHPDLIVLDLMLAPDPVGLAASLVEASPRSQVIICTSWSDHWQFDQDADFRLKVRASKNGVTDWVNKSEGIDELIGRLRAAGHREPVRQGPRNPLEELLESSLRNAEAIGSLRVLGQDGAGLTPMERRVAVAVAVGLEGDMTVEEVCRLRKLTPGNVRTHLKSIYSKWDVHHAAAFVAEARRRGLLSDRS